MINYSWRLYFSIVLFIGLIISNYSFSQEYLPKLDQFKSLQKDSNNFYFKEIWIKSKDINRDDPTGFLRRASSKLDLGYIKEAMPDVDKAISIDSTIGHSYFIKGYILLKCDSLQAALENFNKSIALHDTNIYNYYYRAEIYSRIGNFHEAEFCYNKAISIDKSFPDAYFGLANLHINKFETEQAENLYKKVLELNPSFSYAYFNLALIYIVRDQNKALKYLNKTIDVNPSFAHAYYVRGYLEKDMNRISATYKDWNKAIELDPNKNLYNISLGFLNIQDKNYTVGFNIILESIKKNKLKNFFTYFEDSPREKITNDFINQIVTFNFYSNQLSADEKDKIKNALCLFFLGKFKAAENIYSDLVNIDSTPGLLNYLRGFNLEYLHKAELSLESYNIAIHQITYPGESYLRKGIVLNFLGKYKEAIRCFNTYLKNNDSIRLAHRSLAGAYINILKYDSAIYEFNKLIKSDSTELDIYFDRAYCLKKLENYQEAIKDCDHIIKYKPYNIESFCFEAECKYSAGDTVGAYNLLNQAYNKLHLLTEEGYFIRGSISLAYKKYDSAILDFNEVLDINSQHIDAFIFRGLCYYCKEDYVHAKGDLTSAIKLRNDDLTALYTRGLINIKLNNLNDAFSDLAKADNLGHPLARRAIRLYLKDVKPTEGK